MDSYQQRKVVMTETLTNDPQTQLTGTVDVSLAAMPTEYLALGDDAEPNHGFACSQISRPGYGLSDECFDVSELQLPAAGLLLRDQYGRGYFPHPVYC